MKRTALIFLVVLLGFSCSPRLYTPEVSVPDRYLYGREFSQDTLGVTQAWWTLFGDTTLNLLVDHALAYNRDLAAAVSRIEQARYTFKATRAQFLPQVGLGITAGGEYTPQTKIVQNYAIEPSLSWEISLFGALRNTKRAGRAQILASEWAMRGVRLSLAAEVCTTYFTLLEYERDLSIARRSYRLREESAALIDSMFRYGMSDGVALEQARSLVYAAAADIPLYERAVEQTWLSLCTLVGENPTRTSLAGSGRRLITDAYPADVPIGLPSDLLLRRPDLMQAKYNMEQAAAQAGIARAARFPSISMTGKGGVVSASIKGLTSANPFAWDAAASLLQPLLGFGKLRRNEQAAVEGYKQTALAYEQAALAAFGDVEAALVAISTYRSQGDRYGALVMANDRISTMTRARYANGMADYLNVIDAERELYDSQMQFVNLVAQQYINYVNLFKALGGGW